MKTRILILIVIISANILSAFPQDKPAKLTKEEKKAQKAKEVEELMNSKVFVFTGDYALPTGARQVNLASNPNYMKFEPDMIVSEMPFFGTAYSTTGYGTDTGVRFKSKPEKYEIKKGKKGWDIEAVVTDQVDSYKIYLSVSSSGNAQLSISCNRRSAISYTGSISPVEQQ
jgi:hypothetical protein